MTTLWYVFTFQEYNICERERTKHTQTQKHTHILYEHEPCPSPRRECIVNIERNCIMATGGWEKPWTNARTQCNTANNDCMPLSMCTQSIFAVYWPCNGNGGTKNQSFLFVTLYMWYIKHIQLTRCMSTDSEKWFFLFTRVNVTMEKSRESASRTVLKKERCSC